MMKVRFRETPVKAAQLVTGKAGTWAPAAASALFLSYQSALALSFIV